MRLELANYQTNEIRFADATRWRDGVLELDKEELLGLVRKDPLVARVEIEIALPGDSTRIISQQDAIEPRVKVEGPGMAFPGIMGRPVETVGQGRTNRLGGMTVMTCARWHDTKQYGLILSFKPGEGHTDFIDMSGPGVVSPYASLCNVVVVVEPDPELGPDPANGVVQRAMLAVSDRLAAATIGVEPSEVEIFDTEPNPGLPGIVYIHSLVSPEAANLNPDSTMGTAVYGITRLTQPWLLSPTELLDGVACGNYSAWGSWPLTSTLPLHMCRRHGKDFNYLGAIMVRTMWEEQRQKELMANRAAFLAMTVGAEGAIVTPTLRGQRFLDTITVVEACERAGIKTVLITEEEDNENGNAPPLLVSSSDVAAVVSTGTGSAFGPFPAVEKVIGPGEIAPEWYQEQEPMHGRYGKSHLNDVWGFSKLSCVDY